jgi:membrane protease YdiL (CAAX protease family)
VASRSPLTFFALVFALSVPFWLIEAATGLQLSADLPVSSFIWVCPVIAASILVYREQGTAGVTALLRRSFDVARLRSRVWLLPTILLLPAIQALTFGAMNLLNLPLPATRFSLPTALVWSVGFFVAAECEELGWSGYAIDPLQRQWNALQASLLVGLVWVAFHLVPLLQAHRAPGWIAWWSLGTVSLRVLLV